MDYTAIKQIVLMIIIITQNTVNHFWNNLDINSDQGRSD